MVSVLVLVWASVWNYAGFFFCFRRSREPSSLSLWQLRPPPSLALRSENNFFPFLSVDKIYSFLWTGNNSARKKAKIITIRPARREWEVDPKIECKNEIPTLWIVNLCLAFLPIELLINLPFSPLAIRHSMLAFLCCQRMLSSGRWGKNSHWSVPDVLAQNHTMPPPSRTGGDYTLCCWHFWFFECFYGLNGVL